jgi:cytochrome c biogenesis protein CcdA
MDSSSIPVLSALWLGILTSVNPCPLASNIAAVSFIMKRIDKSSTVFASGLLYTLGRVTGYAALGILVTSSLLNVPQTAHFLQKNMNQMLGPVLIVTGLFLLGLFKFTFSGFSFSEKVAIRLNNLGIMGSFPLGVLFALSFCPSSAALFFGSLIPLSLNHNSPILFPSVYGAGTGLPVLMFAVAIAFGIKNIGSLFNKVTLVEYWTRKITGVLFIVIGIYYILTHIFCLQIL